MAIDKSHSKYNKLITVSNPSKVIQNANNYLGKGKYELFISDNKDKKYMIITPDNKKVHFGSIAYEDYTKHNDDIRRKSYLARASNIKGDWKNNKYSPNLLSQNLLWM